MNTYTNQLNRINSGLENIQYEISSQEHQANGLLILRERRREEIAGYKQTLQSILTQFYTECFPTHFKLEVLRLLLIVEQMSSEYQSKFYVEMNYMQLNPVLSMSFKKYCDMALQLDHSNSHFLFRDGSIYYKLDKHKVLY